MTSVVLIHTGTYYKDTDHKFLASLEDMLVYKIKYMYKKVVPTIDFCFLWRIYFLILCGKINNTEQIIQPNERVLLNF